jgi:hypothetical protein
MDGGRRALAVLATACVAASAAALEPPSTAWLGATQRGLAASEYHLASAGAGAWTAPNRANDLRTTWNDGALLVTPRVDADAWCLHWELVAIGREGAMLPVAAVTGEVVAEGRLEWERGDALREWYLNDARGIEQGLSVGVAPPGPADAPLRVVAHLEGLAADAAPDATSVLLRDASGAVVARMSGLVVADASGRRLPARFEASGSAITLSIEDELAAYPIHVDPVLTTIAWEYHGTQEEETFGTALTTAGDVNGDGYSDVVAGSYLYDIATYNEGHVLAFMGSPGGLTRTPAWQVEGRGQSDYVSLGLGPAGDVNGDGYADLAVGASGEATGVGWGRAYIYCGSPLGLAASPAWQADRAAPAFNSFANAVHGVGDVNRDGFDDLLVGEYDRSDIARWAGAVYLYLGHSTGPSPAPDWQYLGTTQDAMVGNQLSPAGDVNGDGYADVIVAATQDGGIYNGEPGTVYVFHGSPAGLSSVPDWTATGIQSQEEYSQVSTAGDVNGDGYSDVIIGAPSYDAVFHDEGRAELYLGGPGGLAATPAWRIQSNRPANLMGTVACAGDVNGDGFADVLVGSENYAGLEVSEGRVDVFQGSPSGLPLSPTTTIEVNLEGARLGYPVATAGDVNGDGYSDILAGATTLPVPLPYTGAVYLFMGAPGGIATTAAWRTETDQASAGLELTVASAGDVDGDGFSDVLVGAPSFDVGGADAGRVMAFRGGASGLPAAPSWTIDGDQPGARLGASVARAGDVDGDGYSDVVVGAPGRDGGLADEGRVLAYLGSPTGLTLVPAWTADGGQAGAAFGEAVASAGDVNGDGFADVVAGAPLMDGGVADEGAARLYLGSPIGLATTPAWTAASGQAGARFGASLAGAGDVDRDGYADIVIGAEGYSNGEAGEGAAFVYRGGPFGISLAPPWMAEGGQAGAAFGSSVAFAGDIDRDGYSDLAVAAPSHDAGQLDEGRVVVFRGSSSGLEAAPSWSAESNQAGAQLGSSLASAGDVDGDGYSDLLAGASGYDAGQRNEGRAFVWLGSGSGLAASPAWTAESDQADAAFGSSVACAGDVNGDGYSDLLATAALFNAGQSDEGRVSLFYGNGGDGLDRLPRQRRFDDSAPIDLVGLGDETSGFLVKARARSPYGRDRVRLEVEVKPMDVPFDGTGLLLSPFTDTGAPQAGGSFTDVTVAVPSLAPASHRWRARLRGSFPHPWQSHWMSRAENAATEADLRVPVAVPLTCNAGPARNAGCPGGTATLDGRGSLGEPPLTFLWSSSAPEVFIATPNAPTTDVVVSGAGSFLVDLEVRGGGDVESCSTTVSAGDATAPVVACAATLDAAPDRPGEADVALTADATDDCDAAPTITNDRTAGGADASGTYPCGVTIVTFEARDAAGHVGSCATTVTVADVAPPAEVSGPAAGAPLRVSRDAASVHVSFEDRAAPELLNLYAGTIRPAASFAYDHAPLACRVIASPAGAGLVELLAPLEPGASRYYLVSASNCAGESPRGARSDGTPHPDLAGDCGALP